MIKAIRRTVFVLVGVVVLGIGALFLPPVADYFGYARPVPGGLPNRFSAYGIPFRENFGCFIPLSHGRCTIARPLPSRFPPCPTAAYLRKRGIWPLGLWIGIPTLFGGEHSVFIVLGPFSGPGPPDRLALVQAGSCYFPYERTG